jgi:protein-S-isoprenylcysteine O-methyltransferase Ste14
MSASHLLSYLFELPWIAFAVYWLVSALRTHRTKRQESFVSRYGVMLLVVAGFAVEFDGDAKIGVLGRRLFPHSLALAVFGVALTWLGIGLAIWARFHLGRNWSGRVTIKEGHELIRTGPYARFRHPIYSGLLLAAAGSALAIDQWRCVLGVVLILAAFSVKAIKEESMLRQQFGPAFDEHRKHTGFLLPRFR